MITRLVKISLQAKKAGEFETLFYQSQAYIENFDGCRKTNLFRVAGSSEEYFTISYWDNEQALENYRASAVFKDVWSKVKPLFSGKAEAWTLNGVIPL